MEKDAVRAERSPTRCPFCRDELDAKATDDLVACAACGARHHAGCHRAHGRCATCDATDVLVPARRRRGDPPTGSRLRVDQDDEGATRFTWSVATTTDAVLTVLAGATVLLLPLAIWMWIGRARQREQTLRLGPDWVELPVATAGGLSWKRVRVRRDEVGAVRVQGGEGGGYSLTVDVGIERHAVWTGHTAQALAAPELEWLATQLTAWRDQA